ncbi:hypothetical protein O3G_MSEX014073 [Manduca sexta]|uniref:Attractin GBD domain-containing protein n=1 Tax=Manduca sexta TaxID=7130 RepID=A0A922CXU6_MANSE|nr:hypothetical protein O3G_MSEX014073 [Manduca sexta]
MCIGSSFDGRLRSDALKFETGAECNTHTTEAACLDAAKTTAIPCVWRIQQQICVPLEGVGWKESFDESVKACVVEPAFEERWCVGAAWCGACVSAGCVWCGVCAPASSARCTRRARRIATTIEECHANEESLREVCGRYHSCAACHAHQHHHTHGTEELSQRACYWDYDTIKCKAANTSEEIRVSSSAACSAPCATFASCANCTAEECIWCASAARCVDKFTFNLSKKEDRHLSAINFRNAPVKPDVDADFSIMCSAHARMNLTVRTRADPNERTLFSDVNCSNFKYK